MTPRYRFAEFTNSQLPSANYRLLLPSTYIPNIAALIDPPISM